MSSILERLERVEALLGVGRTTPKSGRSPAWMKDPKKRAAAKRKYRATIAARKSRIEVEPVA